MAQVTRRRLAAGEKHGATPVYVTPENCVPFPETAFDIVRQKVAAPHLPFNLLT